MSDRDRRRPGLAAGETALLAAAGLLSAVRGRLRSLHHRALMARFAHCGHGVEIAGRIVLTAPEAVRIGDNVTIGDNAFIRAEGGLEIGEHTHISRNLVLYTVNHEFRGERLPFDERLVGRPVRIGRNVWIGMNVCIAPGTTIGDGAVIGLGTVVSGEVPPLAIVGSPRWRVLGWRDADHYRTLDAAGRHGGGNGAPYPPPREDEGSG